MAVTAEKLRQKQRSGQSGGCLDAPEEQGVDDNRGRRPRQSTSQDARKDSGPGVVFDRAFRLQLLLALGLLFAMTLGLVVGRSMIVTRTYELGQLREELEIARGQTEQMQSEVAAMESAQRLSDIATGQLGMVVPSFKVDEPELAAIVDSSEVGEHLVQTPTSSVESAEDESRVVILKLESEEGQAATANLQQLGWWLLRWLRGAPPVRAGQ